MIFVHFYLILFFDDRVRYKEIIAKHDNPADAELELLTSFMDGLEKIQAQIGAIIGEMDQVYLEKKAARDNSGKDEAA